MNGMSFWDELNEQDGIAVAVVGANKWALGYFIWKDSQGLVWLNEVDLAQTFTPWTAITGIKPRTVHPDIRRNIWGDS